MELDNFLMIKNKHIILKKKESQNLEGKLRLALFVHVSMIDSDLLFLALEMLL